MVVLQLEERVIGTLLRRAAERHADQVFLQFGDLDLTYATVEETANRVANGLRALGLERYGKVAIMLPNCPQFLYAWFGAAKLGAIYVPINTDYKGDILRYQVDKADVTHLVIDAGYFDRLQQVAHALPKLRHVIVVNASAALDALPDHMTAHPFGSLTSAPATEPDVDVRYSDPHAISFTSGTTGPSKGVLAVNCHVVTMALDWNKCVDYVPGEAIYSPLPLFHAIATWVGVVPTLLCGNRIALAERFSASTYWDQVRHYKADIAHGIFSMIPILLKQEPRPDDGDQPARAFYLGQHNADFEARFNCRIVEVFGSTETGIVTMSPYAGERRAGSCGQANAETFDVMLVDDDDMPIEAGETGEIVVRPRQPFSMLHDYYNMPTETLGAFRNLWFHTGDNARMDADGFYYFVDRKKDAIRRRGDNISSFEVESVVNRHAEVVECAAIAVASELGEDEVKVVVVRRSGSDLTAEDLWTYCDAHMPRFWVPRYIEFRDAMPKTPSQKIQKYLLRAGEDAGAVFERGTPMDRQRQA